MNLNNQYVLIISPSDVIKTRLQIDEVSYVRGTWWDSVYSHTPRETIAIPYGPKTIRYIMSNFADVNDVFIVDSHNYVYFYDLGTGKISKHGHFVQAMERDHWNFDGSRAIFGGIKFKLLECNS